MTAYLLRDYGQSRRGGACPALFFFVYVLLPGRGKHRGRGKQRPYGLRVLLSDASQLLG